MIFIIAIIDGSNHLEVSPGLISMVENKDFSLAFDSARIRRY